jgi:hypothetical protein
VLLLIEKVNHTEREQVEDDMNTPYGAEIASNITETQVFG